MRLEADLPPSLPGMAQSSHTLFNISILLPLLMAHSKENVTTVLRVVPENGSEDGSGLTSSEGERSIDGGKGNKLVHHSEGLEKECDTRYGLCPREYSPPPDKHPCDRECKKGENKVCRYRLVVEWTSTLGKPCYDCPLNITDCFRPHCNPGDGIERGIITVNRQLPGTPISVCKGDQVEVDAVNHLPTESISLHWHGLYMHGETKNGKLENATPWSDGVAHVTQCGILPGSSFRYKFLAYPGGSYWYHSHSTLQREDGLYGQLIIREPPEDNPHRELYDEDLDDHVILIQDWLHHTGISTFIPHHWDDGTNKATSMLVNGHGRFKNFGVNEVPGIFTPVPEFTVEKGKRYRFRIINTGFTLCPVQVSIESHRFLVVASDGSDLQPVDTDSLVIHNGERFDIVVSANHSVGTYNFRFGGLYDCEVNKVHATALLVYKGCDTFVPQLPGPTGYSRYVNIPGRVVNLPNTNSGDENVLTLADLRSVPSDKHAHHYSTGKADKVIYASFDFMEVSNPEYYHNEHYTYDTVIGKNNMKTPQFNNITLMLPTSPPLTQPESIEKSMMCNEENIDLEKHCKEGFCRCHHTYELGLGEVVDMFIIDEGRIYDISHPFHLHGTHFQVLAQERFAKVPEHKFGISPPGNSITREEIMEMEKEGKIKRNFDNPPLKDTIMAPDAGYTLIRFRAENPGWWFFHCHMSWHDHVGMGFLFKIGKDGDIPSPPEGFPKCGNFIY